MYRIQKGLASCLILASLIGRLRRLRNDEEALTLKKILTRAPILVAFIFLAACNTVANSSTGPDASKSGAAAGRSIQRGHASWYGPGFHGRKTASGERFNSGEMTAAHRSLPFGTKVRVLHETSGQSVIVRINDRGPFHRGRIIDLAAAPARALGITSAGQAVVSLQAVD